MGTRRPFIAGNWKLHLGPRDSATLAAALKVALRDRGDAEVAVFPTAVSIAAVCSAVDGSGIEVGIQEVHDHGQGAYTGANSPVLSREAGCTRCLIGHSERRQIFGETDEGVHRKIVAALDAGLLPIVCVGETLAQRDAGEVASVIRHQL